MQKLNKIFITTFILIVFIGIDSLANKGFKASISMGNGYAIQEFASANNKYYDAGFAESGFTLSFDGDYYFHNRFALSGRFYFGMSSINNEKNIDFLKNHMDSYYNADSVYTNIKYWQWSSPMIGAKYNYPIIINRLYIETGVFSGITITPIPTQTMIVTNPDNNQTIVSENIDTRSISIPLMFDTAIRLKLNKSIQLKLSASYFRTKTKYQHALYTVQSNTQEFINEIDMLNMQVPVSTINFGIGLVYSL